MPASAGGRRMLGRWIEGRLCQSFAGVPVCHSEGRKSYNRTPYILNGAIGEHGYA